MHSEDIINARMAALEEECGKLRRENAELRAIHEEKTIPKPTPVARHLAFEGGSLTNQSAPNEKITFFRRLFRGREDVYATRWIGRDGKAGYSPAGLTDWSERDDQGRPKRTLLPLTSEAFLDHLTGKQTIGVYPLLPDETCFFLAADFDKKGWQEDAAAFLQACTSWNLPAALERSRSGKGGHVWLFFNCAVPAYLARKMAAALLTQTMEKRHQVGLDSYDRFFPNQDTMPKGGFGNLIALPLQAGPRRDGNSVFLNAQFEPYPDQWAYLSGLPLLTLDQLTSVVADAERRGGIIGLRLAMTEEGEEIDPWLQPPKEEKQICEPLPSEVRVVLSNLVFVEKTSLPSPMINRLLRLAAFQNPEFYRTQAMRLSVFGKPRVIRCGEEFGQYVGLPRGCLEDVIEFLAKHGIKPVFQDERLSGNPLGVRFLGTLYPEQEDAVKSLVPHENGILSATTAFGKTIVAARMIAERSVNTLVLVHRRQLLDQWRERLSTFLDLDASEIGVIGGGKNSPKKRLDIAIIQSLNQKGEVSDLVAEYGQIIVDECHHLSAFSFEQVLRKAKAKYVLGLTATPIRKDGHQPIIFMQCGKIRFRVDARKHAALRPFQHTVIPRLTIFRLSAESPVPPIQEVYKLLAEDADRNKLILEDVQAAVREGRSPLVLTERKSHADWFAEALADKVTNLVVLRMMNI